MSRRAGISLVEVALASGLLAIVGLALMSMFRTGVQSTARAGEVQMASILAAKGMDALTSLEFKLLDRKTAGPVPMDLSQLGEVGDALPPEKAALLADGVLYRGTFEVEGVEPGLLRLKINLTWERQGAGQKQPGTLTVIRLRADPIFAMGVR